MNYETECSCSYISVLKVKDVRTNKHTYTVRYIQNGECVRMSHEHHQRPAAIKLANEWSKEYLADMCIMVEDIQEW